MRYVLYQDADQWFTAKWWYWKAVGAPDAEGHGPYPFKWMAAAAARVAMA
jgi:hypothetical protein